MGPGNGLKEEIIHNMEIIIPGKVMVKHCSEHHDCRYHQRHASQPWQPDGVRLQSEKLTDAHESGLPAQQGETAW
jgi:hypothetical protein